MKLDGLTRDFSQNLKQRELGIRFEIQGIEIEVDNRNRRVSRNGFFPAGSRFILRGRLIVAAGGTSSCSLLQAQRQRQQPYERNPLMDPRGGV